MAEVLSRDVTNLELNLCLISIVIFESCKTDYTNHYAFDEAKNALLSCKQYGFCAKYKVIKVI